MQTLAPKPLALCTALLLAAALAGCSRPHDAPAGARSAAAPQAAPAAVARGKIEVEGGLLELSPAAGGVVQQLLVKEGQQIEKGQLLLRLADDSLRADLDVAQAELALAQARAQAKAARLPALRQAHGRWQAAVREGAADQQGQDDAAQALRDAQSEADVAQTEVAVAQRKQQQLQAQHKRMELRAPEAGTLVRVNTHAGAAVAPAAPVAVVLPQRPLIVRAELNESFVHAVREGMAASVVTDTDSGAAQPLPAAKVVRISPVYGAARLQDDPLRGPARVVECTLAFEQAPQGARVGQNVRVTFHE